MFTVPLPPRHAVTLPTGAVGLVFADHHRVHGVIRVILRAMSFRRVGGLKGVATQEVYAVCHGFKVQGVAAAAHSAEVIKLKSSRYDAAKRKINTQMHGALPVVRRESCARVPVLVFNVDGKPTPRDRADEDLCPDPVRKTRVAPGTIKHIDSNQSVVPRGVDAPAGLLSVIVQREAA